MDVESLLTGTKWQIVELLASKALSPMEIAHTLNTTIANISQQLRLLNAAGLVKKEKTGYGKPGKPRMLFSLASDFAVITLAGNGIAQKKLVRITEKQKQLLKNL